MELAPTTARILSRTHRPETLEDFGLLRQPRRWWETRKQAAAPRHGGRIVLFARGCTIADPLTGRLFLENVDLAFRSGTLTALCDRHEERSSLIAEVLAGLRECTEGTLWTRQRSAWSAARVAGTLALSPTPALDERLNVFQNILSPLVFGGLTADPDEIADVAAHVGLSDRLLTPATYLSILDRFRIAAAQAILGRVNIVVAFAPFTHRSTAECDELFALFSLMTQRGIAVIVTTSETGIAVRADRVVMFSHGDVSADLIAPSRDLVRSLIAQESDDPAVLGPIPVMRTPADDPEESPAWYPVHARTSVESTRALPPAARLDEDSLASAGAPQATRSSSETSFPTDLSGTTNLSGVAGLSPDHVSPTAALAGTTVVPSSAGNAVEEAVNSPTSFSLPSEAPSPSSLTSPLPSAFPRTDATQPTHAPTADTDDAPTASSMEPEQATPTPTGTPSLTPRETPGDQANASSASPREAAGESTRTQRLPSSPPTRWEDDPVTQEIALKAIAQARRLEEIDTHNARREDALREELRHALPSTTTTIAPSISDSELIERAQQILNELPGPVTPE